MLCRRRTARHLLFAFSLGLLAARAVENTWDYSVQVSSSVQASPARITLTWPQPTAGAPVSYAVYRKDPGATSWGTSITLPGSATSHLDAGVVPGTAYEYRIVKTAPTYTAFGYIQTGIQAPLIEHRGKIILLVDSTFTGSLAFELERLEQDMIGDGWTVLRRDVARTDPVPAVKAAIRAAYDTDPANVKALFLFGHIAVPYSGQLNPDGHPDHVGAWPADAYYGDMDGIWTDTTVNFTQTLNIDRADAERMSNRPGDGKFDQNILPSPVELQVGRVDLAKMPGRVTRGGPASFASETDLLRNYLNKDHAFRHARTNPARQAILGDYFGIRGGEAFAASGFRSFAPLVGAENIRNLNLEFNDEKGVWIREVARNDYLLAYGCGPGGYSTMGGLGLAGYYNDGTTVELVSHDASAVFNLVFGSWLGDWDHEDNFLRAPLATTRGLVSVWSGRPHWFLHPMGLGETIGYAARLAQNNTGLYETQINSAQNRIHIALMGDPTLRLHPVEPVSNLAGSLHGATLALTWSPSTASHLIGYHVYRASSAAGPFTRLTRSPISASDFTDPDAIAGATYMVRAIKLENTTSGSYENPSQGVFWTSRGQRDLDLDRAPIAAADSPAPSTGSSAPATPTGNTPDVLIEPDSGAVEPTATGSEGAEADAASSDRTSAAAPRAASINAGSAVAASGGEWIEGSRIHLPENAPVMLAATAGAPAAAVPLPRRLALLFFSSDVASTTGSANAAALTIASSSSSTSRRGDAASDGSPSISAETCRSRRQT